MFGHLKPKDFVNLMEGVGVPARYRPHLDVCARCRATWEAIESVHAEISSEAGSTNDLIPEPDWVQFRSSVRDRVLSRSIQRETALRRWTGWAIRPAMAWGLTLFLVVGLTAVTVLWNADRTATPSNAPEVSASETAAETVEAGPERGLFDDLVQLGDDEQEQFRQILESSQKGSRYH